MLRRSSSGSAVGAIASGTMFWALTNFWRRVAPGGHGMSVRDLFDVLSDVIESSLTVTSKEMRLICGEMAAPPPRHRRGIAAVLRWIVNIVGGDRSKLGRLFVGMVAITREILLRSIGVTSVLLTGVPNRQTDEGDTIRRLDVDAMFVGPDTNFESKLVDSEETSLELVRKDRCEIDQVLHYWFGQASPDGAQKSLWMIASSSQELLAKVDAEISEQFRALIWDLYSGSTKEKSDAPNPDFILDSMVFDKGKLQRWTSDLFGWQGKLAAIIALDQMSRHIHRHDTKFNPRLNGAATKSAAFYIPEQKQLDTIAFSISEQLQAEHSKELSTGMIPLPMRIFGIMPLRHTSTIDNLAIVQHDVEAAAGLHEEMDNMIRRFRKATNRRMNVLQDEARREGKLGPLAEEGVSNGIHNNTSVSHEFDDEQILECFLFDADMSNAHEHVVVKTIRNFLRVNNVLQSTDPRFNSSRKAANYSRDTATAQVRKTQAASCTPTAIVSLSGGVDSMVIASALAYIRDTEAAKRNLEPDNVLHITAIHIDYANRPESRAEASFVERYSKQIGAKFVCRRINEVTRGITARDDYERIAREIRFELYRQCSSEAAKGCIGVVNEGSVGVMLGHHRGK